MYATQPVMWMKCPDCYRRFFFELSLLVILKDSFKINPKLIIICSACGLKIERKYKEH